MIYMKKGKALLPFLLSGMITLSLLTGCRAGGDGNTQTGECTETAAGAGAMTGAEATTAGAEAIADMAGMKCILKMAQKIDGFDYDRFFRANAAMWARIDTREKARWMLGADPHPFNYLRADITVQQFDEFQETYGVKKGDGMYLAPEDRILVW